jgi:ribonuclease BN (tRNA processing enzyme)
LAILHRKATQGDLGLDVMGKMAARAKVKTLVLSHVRIRVGSDKYTPSAKK